MTVLRLRKSQDAKRWHWCHMASFIYRCPNTGYQVQGWAPDNGAKNGHESYEGVTCLACRQVHYVNPETGRMLGARDRP